MDSVYKFKVGDVVRVIKKQANLSLGSVHTIRSIESGLIYIGTQTDGWNHNRFELATPVKIEVEVGDTVEVAYSDDLKVIGVVSHVYGTDGAFDIGYTHYVGTNLSDKVKIIKKVEKEKVWAVGDVVSGVDYASDTILKGTILKDLSGNLVRVGTTWVDINTGLPYTLTELVSPRVILSVPPVS